MRTLVIVGLIAGAAAVFAPDHGDGLMRSVVHGFGRGIGREVAHSLFGHHRWCRSAALDRRVEPSGREKDPPTYSDRPGLAQVPQKAILSPAKRNTSRLRGFSIEAATAVGDWMAGFMLPPTG